MQKIEKGNTVSVNYTGRLEDGTIFDTSLIEGREPLTAAIGHGNLIPGFEAGLLGMGVGEKKTIEIEPNDAYGEVIPEMVIQVNKTQVPEGVQVDQVLEGNGPMGPVQFRVLEVQDTHVVLDANHPLAGKKLIFDLEVIGIN